MNTMIRFKKKIQKNKGLRWGKRRTFSSGVLHSIVSFGLVFLFFCTLSSAPTTVHAQSYVFSGGMGSLTNPWEISTGEDLDSVRFYLNSHFVLVNDIDLTTYLTSSTNGWEPIGDDPNAFTGSLNGAGFTISGLWIARPAEDTVGLFGFLQSATIENLSIEVDNASGGIVGQNYVGALAGIVNFGHVNKCCVVGDNGGVIGNGLVTGTYTGASTGNMVGGLTGRIFGSDIINCYACCEVTGFERIGGLAGEQVAYGGSDCMIKNCYAVGAVTCASSGALSAGGLVGRQFSYLGGVSSIVNCYTVVDVNGDNRAGGIVGSQESNDGHSSITNCYAVGNVNASLDYAGGIVGRQIDIGTISTISIINNFHYPLALITQNSLPIPVAYGITSLHGDDSRTAINLMTQSAYVGWDFSAGAWQWDNNEKFPQIGFGPEAYPFPFYAITYNMNGADPMPMESYTDGSGFNPLPTPPARARYQFDGWFDNPALTGMPVTMIGTSETGHKTYWANWTRTVFDVFFEAMSYGTVTSNRTSAMAGESIMLTVTPNAGYELSGIKAYQTSNPSVAVVLVGSGNQYNFFMPASDVTVSATYVYTGLNGAKLLLEQMKYEVWQEKANTPDEVVDWLVEYINKLLTTTGIVVSPSDIEIADFTAAVKGTTDNSSGSNGGFTFSVTLANGASSLTVAGLNGTIVKSEATFNIIVHTVGNGSVSVSPTATPTVGILISLIILPDRDNEISDITVYRTDSPETVVLYLTGYTPLFSMPPCDVTIVVTFKDSRSGNDPAPSLSGLKACVVDGRLHVSGLTPGKYWNVYSVSGSLVYRGMAFGDEADIALPGRGVYVVHTDNGTNCKISIP